jgi:methionyl-tRNA formyltransferase
MNVIFLGTPQFGVPALKALFENKYNIIGVITNPDKPSGRKKVMTPSPIKEKALELNLPVFQPANKKELELALSQLGKIDLAIVAAYGKIIPKSVLNMAGLGFINIHGSLLPHLRGAIPIPMSIKLGDKKSGITIMKMDENMDTGDILSQEGIPIKDDDTTLTLSSKLSFIGATLLIETLPGFINGSIKGKKQNDKAASYCYISDITKDNSLIDFNNLTAIEIDRIVRACYPQPLAWFKTDRYSINLIKIRLTNNVDQVRNNPVIKCKEGMIELEELQPSGKRIMSGDEFLRGYKHYLYNFTIIS